MLWLKGFDTATRCWKCGQIRMVRKVGNIWLCSDCRSVKGYGLSNWDEHGAGSRPILSVEFETSKECPDQYSLVKWGFIPTSDSSIGGIEWKSPIYTSWQTFYAACRWGLEPLADLVGDDTGTHIHVNAYNSARTRFGGRLDDLVGPLQTYLERHCVETIRIWGRYFNHYSIRSRYRQTRDGRLEETDWHHLWVSPYTRYQTVEWRLPRFIDYRQFYKLARFCVAATKAIDDGASGQDLLDLYKKHFRKELVG